MKQIVIWAVLIIALIGVVGCGSNIPTGKYVHQDDPEWYIELKPGGIFFAKYKFTFNYGLFDGTYKISGNTITFHPFGPINSATIKGNTLVAPDGTVYVKGGT
jgi:hypothetical protein